MTSISTKPRKAGGFTLVEVLVVIAVIAILAGMLLPVLASTRAVSRKAVCQSNLRQLYAAFQMYIADWSDALPCPGGQMGDYTYWAQDNGGGIDLYLKNQHLGMKSVYCCPSYTVEWKSPYPPRSYGMNAFLRVPPDRPYGDPVYFNNFAGIPQEQIWSLSRTILLYEGIQEDSTNIHGDGYVARCGSWTQVKGFSTQPLPHYRDAGKPCHGKTNNYLMCDGHIMTMQPEKYPGFNGPTSRANNFWYAQSYR